MPYFQLRSPVVLEVLLRGRVLTSPEETCDLRLFGDARHEVVIGWAGSLHSLKGEVDPVDKQELLLSSFSDL